MILKHRDTEVLRFEWLEPQGVRIVSVNDAASRFLPLDMHGEATDEGLWRWLKHRVVPKHRAYIEDLLARLGLNAHDLRGIIRICRGLSLNDVFWVVEDGFSGRWKDYNLYENRFSDIVAAIAFTGGGPGVPDAWPSSPELTTNGMLAKCWRRRNGVVELYKSGTTGALNAGFEPYSEFYAAQLAEAMGIDFVPYGLSMFKGRLCSTCPLFTSDKYGYLPAGRLLSRAEALKDPRFADIFLLDAVIFNTDRHMGNFGYLIDNDTNEIVGAAPVFDNGYGLFSLATWQPGGAFNEFDDLRRFVSRVRPALYADWLKFHGSSLSDEQIARVRRLHGFRFCRHKRYNLPAERLERIEDFTQKRIAQILEFGCAADEYLKITNRFCTVNSTAGGADCTIGMNRHDSLSLQIVQNMKADPFITKDELAEILQVSPRTIAARLKELQADARIRRVGPPKTGHWEVLEKTS